jgi:hypothetical protein
MSGGIFLTGSEPHPLEIFLDPRLEYIYIPTSVARVAQWLQRRAQRSDDPCVGGSNHTGTWVPVFRMRPYKLRSRVAVGVARLRSLSAQRP